MDTNFYVYGAGIVATTLYTAIKKLYNVVPEAFVVSDRHGNPNDIDGIPVVEISTIRQKEPFKKYVIAAPEVHHDVIKKILCSQGVLQSQLIFVDSQLENALLDRYYCGEKEFFTVSDFFVVNDCERQVDDSNANQNCSVCQVTDNIFVAQAKSHVDKPLASRVELPKYIYPLQVGAVFTDEVIAEMRDNEGVNISHKNRNYCELTATYSLWKNIQAQYKGLCHYRRIFTIGNEQIQRLMSGEDNVDVILPYPSIHYPDVSGQHKRYVNEGDWNAMLEALRDVAPGYYEAYMTEISRQQYFYNYNMLIAKRDVFDDYCEFLFAVLQRTEELSTPKGSERADRYIGYLGENLTTIYFLKNKSKLRSVHVGKQMLV